MNSSTIHGQLAELRSAAATLRRPGGTITDRISAELIERAAQTIAARQRAPLPANAVTDLLPMMQDGWTLEDYGTWAVRAAERAHGIGGDAPNPAPPSWAEAPNGYNFRAMDSDGHWCWFKDRPYPEMVDGHGCWDSDEGLRQARWLRHYPGWNRTLETRPEAV